MNVCCEHSKFIKTNWLLTKNIFQFYKKSNKNKKDKDNNRNKSKIIAL